MLLRICLYKTIYNLIDCEIKLPDSSTLSGSFSFIHL